MMKIYFLLLALSLCAIAEAQNTKKKFTYSLQAGPIFSSFAPTLGPGRIEDRNRWNIELHVEENRLHLGIITRYITSKGFIPNPFFAGSKHNSYDRNTVKVGDLIYRIQRINNFSFMLNKYFFLENKMEKHRFDIALGTQLRDGSLSYFSHFFGWETHTTGEYMDKFGILTRLGYSYALNKHVNLTMNFEYARFKKNPVDFFDINILIGFKY